MSKAESKRMFGIWCRSLRQTMTLVNTDLITQAMPALGGSAAFAVQVGAENELLVPFMMQNTNDYFEGYETVRFEKAFPGTYTMKMTDLPERRLLRFEVK